MKKSLHFLSVIALSLIFINPSHAQLFQNTNSDCEEIPIISTLSGMSVACKYYNSNISNFPYAGADFDGSTYPDCVIGSSTTAISPSTTPQSSVLINLGTAATACTSGTGDQFDTADNYNLTGLVPASTSSLASTVTGPIANAYNATPVPNSDFGIPLLPAVSPSAETVLAVANNSGGAGTFPASPITSTNVSWDQASGDFGFLSSAADKNAALFDCDGDGDLDAAMMVQNDSPASTYRVNLLLNNGSGLQAASLQANTGITYTSGDASLAIGDFNNDGNNDVVVATSEGGGDSFVEVCTNNGSCTLTCLTAAQVNLDTVTGASPTPSSIAAGDFDGDGNVDAAVTTPGLSDAAQGILVLFGNGSAAFPSNLSVNYAPVTGGPEPNVLATACFDNNNNPDLALTYGGQLVNSARVGVFTAITTAAVTSTTLTFNDTVNLPWGIDTADFDAQGGDDILMVATSATNTGNPRQAFVFMNSVETIVANAGSDVTMENTGSLALSGSCATSPADASATFAQAWTILSPASGGTLTNATTLTPTFTATENGTYTLRLTCRTRCDDTATDTVVITVNGLFLEGSGVLSNGCAFNPLATFSWTALLTMFSALGIFWGIRRRK